jgi:hypothetical protein
LHIALEGVKKMRKKLTVFLVIALMMIGNVVPALAADALISLSISASADEYVRGSNVVVTGTVLKDNNAGRGVNPTVTLKDPNNSVIDTDQVSDSQVGNDGSFSLTFVLGATAALGTYIIEANGGGQTATDSFKVNAAPAVNVISVTTTGSNFKDEAITVSGTVKKLDKPFATDVTIVVKKDGNRVDIDQTRATNGSYTWTYVPSATGSYEVTVSALEVSASTTFNITLRPTTPGPVNPGTNPPVNPNPNPGNQGGEGTVKPSQEEIDNIIKDPTAKEIKVEIKASESSTKVEAELDKNVFASIIQSNKPLVIESNGTSISLNNNVLKGIQQSADGNVSISVEYVDAKNITAPETVKGQKITSAILDFNVNVTKADSTITKITKFNEAVNVAIKVDATQLNNPKKAAVYYLNEKTNAWEYVGGKVAGDSFNFATDHFSSYAVISNNKTFKDIEGQGWAKEQIEVLASRTIIKGKSEDSFAPGDNITRAQFSMLLARALRLPQGNYEGIFSDVPSTIAGASKEIEAAYRAGIVTGVNGKFNPNEAITRQQMAAMIIRAVKYQDNSLVEGETGTLSFADASKIDEYAKEYVALAVKLGIITGKENGTIFAPKENATRSQTAVILYRFLESLKEL